MSKPTNFVFIRNKEDAEAKTESYPVNFVECVFPHPGDTFVDYKYEKGPWVPKWIEEIERERH